jgi:hypothetical protein
MNLLRDGPIRQRLSFGFLQKFHHAKAFPLIPWNWSSRMGRVQPWSRRFDLQRGKVTPVLTVGTESLP